MSYCVDDLQQMRPVLKTPQDGFAPPISPVATRWMHVRLSAQAPKDAEAGNRLRA